MGKTAAAIVCVTLALTVATPSANAGYISDTTWNRLAECEAGGRWGLVTTWNGHFFVFQFVRSTWNAYRGTYPRVGYYVRRWQAPSKYRLKRVAHRVQHAQGWAAWPYCSSRL